MSNRGQRPRTEWNSLSISLEGCTPAKMAAGAAAPKAHSILSQHGCAVRGTGHAPLWHRGTVLRPFDSWSLCPFVSLSFCLLVPLSPLLSFFNIHPALPTNSLKTKDLRKRHFRLKFLSQGKPLKLKTLGAKFAHYFSHFPADPTLHTPPKSTPHTPPRNPAPCKVLCRI